MALLDHRPLHLTFTRALGSVVVGVAGDLDAGTADELRARLIGLTEGQGCLEIVLDLRDLAFVDSTGLGVMIGAVRRLRERGGDLVLSAPPRPVLRAIAASGLDGIFTITRA